MHTRKIRLFPLLAILLLAFALAACGGDEAPAATSVPAAVADTPAPANTPAPADTPVPDPTDTPEPAPTEQPAEETAPTPEPEQELDTSNIGYLEEILDSYTSVGAFSTIIEYPDGDTKEQSMTFDIDWAKSDNPFGGDMRMEMSGFDTMEDDPDAPESISIYAVGDSMLIRFGEEWITSTREDDGLTDLPMFYQDPDDLIRDIKDLKREGKETINGIDTVHYSFEEDAPFFQNMFGEDDPGDEELESVRGDIWIAEDDGYIVKFTWEAAANNVPETDESGAEVEADVSIIWSFEISDINNLDSIELPESAPEPGSVEVPGFESGEFPLPPDTVVEGSFGGIVSLVSELSEADINAFFDEELTALGWTKEEGFIPQWSKDGVSFTLMVTPGDVGGTQIMIMGDDS